MSDMTPQQPYTPPPDLLQLQANHDQLMCQQMMAQAQQAYAQQQRTAATVAGLNAASSRAGIGCLVLVLALIILVMLVVAFALFAGAFQSAPLTAAAVTIFILSVICIGASKVLKAMGK